MKSTPGDAALQLALKTIERRYGAAIVGSRRVPHKWDAPINDLERVSKIPAEASGAFRGGMLMLLMGAEQAVGFRTASARERAVNRNMQKAETALRTAYDAVRSMNAKERAAFERAFLVAGGCRELLNEDNPPGTLGLSVLEALVESFSSISGKSPAFEPRRGSKRPKGTVGDWHFQQFVGALWQTVSENGGVLSFNCHANKGSGTMVEALTIVRLFLPGLIPAELSAKAKTIERIKKTLATQTYPGFHLLQSVELSRIV